MLVNQQYKFATLAWGALAISVAAALGFGVALLLGGSGNHTSDANVAAPVGTEQTERAKSDSTKDLARRKLAARRRARAAERLAQAARDRRVRITRDARRRARRAAASRRRARRASASASDSAARPASTSRARESRPAVQPSPPRRVEVAPSPRGRIVVPRVPAPPAPAPQPAPRDTFDDSG